MELKLTYKEHKTKAIDILIKSSVDLFFSSHIPTFCI